MELTIYNTYVVMESQKQCDRMKKLCIDNGLPIWEANIAFQFDEDFCEFSFAYDEFFIGTNKDIEKGLIKVTEEQFIELLKSNK